MGLNYFECLEIAKTAAKSAGEIQMMAFGRKISLDFKGPKNLVTDVDLQCERSICEIILERFPEHAILAEERGSYNGDSLLRWIIDPLDGTTNFAHAYPYFSTSIAFEVEGEVVLGVVYNPVLKELFSSIRGMGALLNENPISTSKTERLDHALIVTGRLAKIEEDSDRQFEQLKKIAYEARALRIDGSAALDICSVAMGRYDAFWEFGLKPWDTAAGSLILKEAGGDISTFSGNPFDIAGTELLCSNGFLHIKMIEALTQIM